MRKLLLVLLFAPLFNSCSKSDDTSSGEFFANHQNKIWVDTVDEGSFGIFTYYIGFSNGTYNFAAYEDDRSYFCNNLIIGTKNNFYDVEWENVFGKGAEINFTTAIIVNKANELQIESIFTSLDGSKTYTILYTFIVNGDNLTLTLNDDGFNDTLNLKIYNGNLDINFNNCQSNYAIY